MRPSAQALLLLAAVLVLGCQDKAQAPYERGEALEKDQSSVEGAISEYDTAAAADPNSTYGRKAAERAAALRKLLEELPANVTRPWCARLRKRLRERFIPQATSAYPNRGSDYINTVVTDFVVNLEYNCIQDIGRPTAGRWECYWNSNFDTYEGCEKMKAR